MAIIDLWNRLVSKLDVKIQDRDNSSGKRTADSVMTVLSTIFSEVVERGLLESNPAAKMPIKYRKRGFRKKANMLLLSQKA